MNPIAPERVCTDTGDGMLRADTPGGERLRARTEEGALLGRPGEPADGGGIAVPLASSHCTGATYRDDRGWTAT